MGRIASVKHEHNGQAGTDTEGFQHTVADPSSKQAQSGDIGNGQTAYTTGSEVHRRVSVKGSGGVAASVAVIVRQGEVWVSIVPPFTWEAIMEPGKVDELIRTLGLAREDAKRMKGGKRRTHPVVA